MSTRLSAEDRKRSLIEHALRMAEEKGFTHFSSPDVGRSAGCQHTTVLYHFKTMDNLRNEVMEMAVKTGNLRVIGDGIMRRHPVALAAPEKLKKQALKL